MEVFTLLCRIIAARALFTFIVDSTTDNVVMHIAEVSANNNCKLEYFLQDEHLVILSMMGGVVPHDQMEKLLHLKSGVKPRNVVQFYDGVCFLCLLDL